MEKNVSYHDVLDVELRLASGVGLVVLEVTVHIAHGDGGIGQAGKGQKLGQILVGVELRRKPTKLNTKNQKSVKRT